MRASMIYVCRISLPANTVPAGLGQRLTSLVVDVTHEGHAMLELDRMIIDKPADGIFRVHRSASRWQRIKRDDPCLFDGKKRERNGRDLLKAR